MKTLLFAVLLSVGGASSVLADTSPLDQWVREQKPKAAARLREAISPYGAAKGAVFASPSRSEPDYYYHWVRDAALVMREVLATREMNSTQVDHLLRDYIDFSRRNQLTPNPSGAPSDLGLGEPKFNMDGSAFMASWGRPQNDGPALRAILIIEYATQLWAEGKGAFISQYLYRPEIPATTLLKADLEFVAHHWRDTSFDLWEESRGDQFYTRMAQWRALEAGSDFARLIGDSGAADYYGNEASLVLASMNDFWSPNEQYIRITIRPTGGIEDKYSGLDIATILAVNQLGKIDGPFSVRDPRVMSTALALEERFRGLFPINRMTHTENGDELGAGIGRYPEDRYDGYRTDRQGNPWYLATQGMAEFYYQLAAQAAHDPSFLEKGTLKGLRSRLLHTSTRGKAMAARLKERGDAFFRRSQYHSDRAGHQAEQFSRENGMALGARDLTWSYASFLSAERVRTQLIHDSAFSRFVPRSQPSHPKRK